MSYSKVVSMLFDRKNMEQSDNYSLNLEKNLDNFLQDLQKVIDDAVVAKKSKHLFLLNISNLLVISSIYGHEMSQEIMENLITKLKKDLSFDKIYFISDDILAFISENQMDEGQINLFIRKIKESIQFYNYSHDQSNEPFHLTFKMSIIEFPKFSDDARNLYMKAMHALANVRTDIGKFFNTYTDFLTQQKIIKNEMQQASYFKNAILNGRLRLAYQPIINGQNGKVNHYECLLRIIDENGEIISAGPFIPIAENLDFINVIDELVLEMVVNEVKNSENVKFAFNLSSMGVYNEQWLEKARELLADPKIASRIIVEITETAIHRDIGKVAYFIAMLQEIGCQVALDDFGTGHTSFRQLKSLPVDIVKIDGSFIRGIATRSEDELFIKVLLGSIQSLGFKSIAEFVENGEVAKILMELGVDYMQGHYFSEAKNHRSWEHL